MADRSDDIKQLFSHLGLNPGDYQELRNKTPVAAPREAAAVPPKPAAPRPTAAPTRQPAAAPAAVAPAVAPVPAARPAAPVTAKFADPIPARPAAPVVPPPAPVAAPVPPPVSAAPSVPAAPPPTRVPEVVPVTRPAVTTPSVSSQSTDNAQRWSLLRSVVETPPRVVSVEPATVAPVAEENRPTRRLLRELSRRPIEATAEQLIDGARRRWHDPSEVAEKAVDDVKLVAPKPVPAPPPVAAVAPPPPRPAPVIAPAPVAAPPAAVSPAAPVRERRGAVADVPLADAFRRLVAPERTPQQASGSARLHFNYGPEVVPPGIKQPREEKLDDVFSRISGPRRTR